MNLYEEYAEVLKGKSNKAIAETELRIWGEVIIHSKPKLGFREWMHEKFNGNVALYEQRRTLLVTGPDMHPIWKMLDEGLLTSTAAAQLRRQATKFHRSGKCKTLAEGVAKSIEGWKNKYAIPDDEPPPESENPTQKSKTLGKRVERLALDYASEFATDIPSEEMRLLILELKGAIQVACDEFRRGLMREKKDVKELRAPTKRTREKAGEILAVYVPSGRLGPELIKRLRAEVTRSKHTRLRELHPDLNGGKETAVIRREMKAVAEAADILMDHFRLQESKHAK